MRADFTGLRSQRLALLLRLPCALAPGPSSLAGPAAGPGSIVTGLCPWVRPPSGSGAGLQGREAAGGGLQKGFEGLGGGGAAQDPGRLVRLLDRAGGVQGLRGTAAGTVGVGCLYVSEGGWRLVALGDLLSVSGDLWGLCVEATVPVSCRGPDPEVMGAFQNETKPQSLAVTEAGAGAGGL